MNYKWKIKIILSSGETLFGIYKCTHVNSKDVAEELLSGDTNTFSAIGSNDGTSQIFFRIGDVSAMEISA